MSRSLQLPFPRAYLPLLEPGCRYRAVHGGRGSGKSWAFAQLLLARCLQSTVRAVCVREVQRSLEQSVKRLLEDQIARHRLTSAFRIFNTHLETHDGGVVIFQGLQSHTAESIKSLEGYDIAWVEEAQTLSQRSLDILRPTIRKPGSELWFSWNPARAKDPVDQFFRGVAVPPDAVVLGTTYWDNPWLPNDLRQELMWDQARDPDKYAHVWLGEYERRSEARVFRNWRVEPVPTPDEDTTVYFGADWGYAIDPTVLIRCWVQGRTVYVDREVYKVGCEIDQTPALFDRLEGGQARLWTCVADSARPETISYMRRHGYPRMVPAKKGPGSVEEGVSFLQSYDIVVDPQCRHTIDELTLYSYKTDRLTGDPVPILEDKRNHVIDALRYATERIRRPSDEHGLLFVDGGSLEKTESELVAIKARLGLS